MKKYFYYTSAIVVITMFFGLRANAQSKIKDGTVAGSSSLPDTNAVLDLESATKGLLIPRVALINVNSPSPLTVNVAGMIVYNTATVGNVTPGYYFNNGIHWQRILSTDDMATSVAQALGSSPARDSVIAIFNSQFSNGSITGHNLTTASGGALTINGGAGTTLQNTSISINKDSIVTASQVADVLNTSPARDSLTGIINGQISNGSVTGHDLSSSSNALTITGGSGAVDGKDLTSASSGLVIAGGSNTSLQNTSISLVKDSIVTASQVAHVLNTTPARDTLTGIINSQIGNGAVSGKNFTSTSGALTITGGNGTSLQNTSIALNKDSVVTTAQVARVLNTTPAKDTLTGIINAQISGGAISGKNFTSTSGALTITGGNGTSLQNTSIALNKDSVVTTSQVARVLNTTPAKDTLTGSFITQYQGGIVWSTSTGSDYVSPGLDSKAGTTMASGGMDFGSWLTKTSDVITPLPITLVDFSAKAQGCHVNIHWATESEGNCKEFVLERGVDGISFKPVATVRARGDNNKYDYIDTTALPGDNLYRLTMMSKDNHTRLSNIVAAVVDCNNQPVFLYPNPTKGIVFISGLKGNEKIQLTDVLGRVLKEVASKQGLLQIDLGGLASAPYNITIVSGNNLQTFKVVKTD